MIGGGNDVNDARGRRRLNAEIILLPLAAVLMALTSFLTFTATWTTQGRINLDAQWIVMDCNSARLLHECAPPLPKLHVIPTPEHFLVVWREAVAFETAVQVPRSPTGELTELTTEIARQWQRHGRYQRPSDNAMDQVVLHCAPLVPYREMVAIIDAINEVQREFPGSQGKPYPALNVELVVDEP